MNIDYSRISRAITHYKGWKFAYIDTDWAVSRDILNITCPRDFTANDVFVKDKILVASGEQSLLSDIIEEPLPEGLYMTCTPCFRPTDAGLSEYHHPYFMKLELMHYFDPVKIGWTVALNGILNSAYKFHESEGFDAKYLAYCPQGSNAFDLEYKGIELGSYGYRMHIIAGDQGEESRPIHWIYGTGLAEPRVTQALRIK